MADFDRTIELKQDYPNAYFNRGICAMPQATSPAAMADYTAALQVGPPDAAIFNSRGHAYYRLEKVRRCVRDYGEAIKVDPAKAAALINRGDTYLRPGPVRRSRQGLSGRGARRAAIGPAPIKVRLADGHLPRRALSQRKAGDRGGQEGDRDGGADNLLASNPGRGPGQPGRFAEAKASQEKAISLAQ